MKRLLVLSDTHGRNSAIDLALIKAGDVDAVIHLGDYIRDAFTLRDKGRMVYCVKGNCDFNDEAETEILLHIAGNKILITHGHTYGVKFSRDRLIYRAMELNANAALYGHTHIAYNGYNDGILVLNPGSIAEPRAKRPTFAILEAGSGQLRAELKLL